MKLALDEILVNTGVACDILGVTQDKLFRKPRDKAPVAFNEETIVPGRSRRYFLHELLVLGGHVKGNPDSCRGSATLGKVRK